MELVFFYILSFLILSSALAVILLPNPIHSTLSLIVTLVSVAGMFALMEAHFLATVQVIVYAGAVVVLVLFVVMLLNAKNEEIQRKPVAIFFSTLSAVVLFSIMFPLFNEQFGPSRQINPADKQIQGTATALGDLLYTQFTFPFEVASLLIMAALVGAVMVGRSRREDIDHLLADTEGEIQSVVNTDNTEIQSESA